MAPGGAPTAADAGLDETFETDLAGLTDVEADLGLTIAEPKLESASIDKEA